MHIITFPKIFLFFAFMRIDNSVSCGISGLELWIFNIINLGIKNTAATYVGKLL